MQGVVTGLILVFLLALTAPASAKPKSDGVPTFDVARSCKEARAYAGDDKELAYRGCMKDEADARAEMVKKWNQFKPADRQDCVAQGAAPMPSYVEILTCMEMSEEAGALFLPNGAARGNSTKAAPAGNALTPPPPPPSPLPSSPQPPPSPPNADPSAGSNAGKSE